MSRRFFLKILRWWSGGSFPNAHLFISQEKRPKGFYQAWRVYLRKWLVHPFKRRLARYWLLFLKIFFGLSIIGITGSAGKTTTKEMVASVLSQKGRTVKSYANIDPIFNIPTTILKCRPRTRYLVLEMGIEFLGEMDFYLWLAKPDTAILTSLYFTHTEFLGGLEGVIREKTKIVEAMGKDGTAILNSDDPLVLRQKKKAKGKVVLYATARKADVKGKDIQISKDLNTEFLLRMSKQSVRVSLPTLGEQNVSNALAAAAVGRVYKVPLHSIKVGLESFSAQPHRMKPVKHSSGAWIIDDAYNSNPLAAKRALDALVRIPAKHRIAVLGTMKELGEYEEEGHREVGEYAGKLGVDEVIGFGGAIRGLLEATEKVGVPTHYTKSKKEIVGLLQGKLKEGTVFLIKGSKTLQMETLIEVLLKL